MITYWELHPVVSRLAFRARSDCFRRFGSECGECGASGRLLARHSSRTRDANDAGAVRPSRHSPHSTVKPQPVGECGETHGVAQDSLAVLVDGNGDTGTGIVRVWRVRVPGEDASVACRRDCGECSSAGQCLAARRSECGEIAAARVRLLSRPALASFGGLRRCSRGRVKRVRCPRDSSCAL